MERLALLLFMFLLALPARAQTPIVLNESAGNYASIGMGLNIGTANTYDGLIEGNILGGTTPSLQPGLNVYVLNVGSVTTSTTTVVDYNIYSQILANQYAGGTYTVACSAKNNYPSGVQICNGTSSSYGCTGTVTSNTANTGSGSTFVLSACANGFSAYDTIIINGPQTPDTLATMNWGYTSTGTGSVAVNTTGADLYPGTVQCIQLNTGSGTGTASVFTYTDNNGLVGNFTQINGTYTTSALTNILAGSGVTLTATVVRSTTGGVNASAAMSPTGSGWQTTTGSFTASEANNLTQNSLKVEYTLSGPANSSVCIGGLSVVNNADAATGTFLNRQAITDLTTITDAQELRFSWPINADTITNLLATETVRAGTNPIGGKNQDAASFGEHPVLAAAAAKGIKTMWLNIPINFSQSDVQEFVNYLAGTSGTGAAIRIALGQTAPWTSVFSRIVIEPGNEEWNNSNQESLPGYSGCGTEGCWNWYPMSINFANWLKTATGWNSSIMKVAVGIQTGNGSAVFDLHAADTSSQIDFVALNQYMNYGPQTVCTAAGLYTPTWIAAWAYATDNSQPWNYTVTGGGGSVLYPGEVYEGQYNYAGDNSCTQAQLVGWPEGEGSIFYDTMNPALLNKYFGTLDWDFFVLNQNNFEEASNGSMAIWGIVTGPGGNYTNPRPAAYAMGMYDTCAALGTGYAATPTSPPTLNFSSSNGVPAYSAVPLIQSVAFKNGTNRCVAVWNPDTTSHAITLTGTNAPSSATVTVLSSVSTTTSNEGANAALAVQPSTATTSFPYTIPAYGMATFVFTTGGPATSTSAAAGFKLGGGKLQ